MIIANITNPSWCSTIEYLNKKDSWSGWRIGMNTNRFKSIDQIHSELKKQFKGQTIVTYEQYRIFKEMLYFKDGKNLGYKFFGEVWSDILIVMGKNYVTTITIIFGSGFIR